MTAARASLDHLHTDLGRLEHALDVLRCSVYSGDTLTARYAAATITEASDRIETALLAVDRDAKALRVGAVVHLPGVRS